jgi:hypothetical protein
MNDRVFFPLDALINPITLEEVFIPLKNFFKDGNQESFPEPPGAG